MRLCEYHNKKKSFLETFSALAQMVRLDKTKTKVYDEDMHEMVRCDSVPYIIDYLYNLKCSTTQYTRTP